MKRCPRLVGDWTLSEVIFVLPSLQSQISELEEISSQPEFWNDPASANKTLQKLSRIKNFVAPLKDLNKTERDIAELYEMLREDPSEELEKEADHMAIEFLKELDKYELKTLLSGEHDGRNALLEINAGAGGSEACDWASILFRMYSRWAQTSGYKLEILSETPGDVTGYRSVQVMISGENAYAFRFGRAATHVVCEGGSFAGNRRGGS